MAIIDSYPLFTVSRLADSRDFFLRHFDMQVVFEANWVAMLGFGDSIRLGLMTAEHPSRPPGPEVFSGEGAIFTIQTDDAAALLAHKPLTNRCGDRFPARRTGKGLRLDQSEAIGLLAHENGVPASADLVQAGREAGIDGWTVGLGHCSRYSMMRTGRVERSTTTKISTSTPVVLERPFDEME